MDHNGRRGSYRISMLLGLTLAVTAAGADPRTEVDKALLQRGLTALNAKTYEEARDHLLKAIGSVDRNVKALGDDHVLACEALGTAYLHLQDYAKASAYFETPLRQGRISRPLLLNSACANLRRGDFARCLAALERHLQKSPQDEVAIDMLGVALSQASAGKSRISTTRYVQLYQKLNTGLETQRAREAKAAEGKERRRSLPEPKVRHLGTQWLTQLEYDDFKDRCERVRQRVETLKLDLARANDELENARRARERRMRSARVSDRYYESRVESAEHDVEAVQLQIEQAEREMPAPEWKDLYEPLPIERL